MSLLYNRFNDRQKEGRVPDGDEAAWRAWLFLEQDCLHSSAELERESDVSREGKEGIVDVLAYCLLRRLGLFC